MKRKGIKQECTKVIAVRVTPFDRDVIHAVAQSENIAMSDVIRWALAVWQEHEGERIREACRSSGL
jgi:hypothetical protein